MKIRNYHSRQRYDNKRLRVSPYTLTMVKKAHRKMTTIADRAIRQDHALVRALEVYFKHLQHRMKTEDVDDVAADEAKAIDEMISAEREFRREHGPTGGAEGKHSTLFEYDG